MVIKTFPEKEEKNNLGTKNSLFRNISKDKYIIAGVITILIFSLGLMLGLILEDYRYNIVDEINTEQEINHLSLQMQYLYLDVFRNYNNCPILSTTLKETIEDLDQSLSEVIAYEEDNENDGIKKNLIMRRYALDNLRYWLLALERKERCDFDIVPILYLYATECPSCPNQGAILTYFKKKFGEQVLVFPINLDLRNEEPMIEITIKQFNLTKFPTMIIDNKKYEGVIPKEKMGELICNSLQNSSQCPEESVINGKD